ncbi:MAG: substrate-binding domain-containing protein [Spirochaetales bacterium]|nr:substrate-binding domain-containing protein [Spirochaetales bacterium]
MIHPGQEKGLTIAYINDICNYHWSFDPWIGALKTAGTYNANLISFHGNEIRTPLGYYRQENIIYDLAKSGKIDGHIIWKGNLFENLSIEESEAFCTAFGTPLVTILGAQPGYPSINYGNFEGMRMVVDHLIEVHGYSKIGFVGYMEHEKHVVFQGRYKAYCESMEVHSLPIDPSFVVPFRIWESPVNGLSMDEALSIWLEKIIPRGLEAIVGLCDPIAEWVIRHCSKLGYSVPSDIAVVGFDYSYGGRMIYTPLTTVDPCWVELGVLGVETLIDMIQGKPVPEKRIVEPKLIIARSCGCMEESIKNVPGISVSGLRMTTDRKTIIDDMMKTLHETGNRQIRALCETMLSSIIDKNREDRELLFLSSLEKALAISGEARDDILDWQNVISILHTYATGLLDGAGTRYMNILCHKGRIMVSNAASRLQANRRSLEERQSLMERTLGLQLITTFDLEQLLDLLVRNFPDLGITRFYVSLFREPQKYIYPEAAPELSRLILAHNDSGRINLGPDGILYKTRDILPDKIWPETKLTLSVNPLYFQDTQIGLLMFDNIPGNMHTFEGFRSQLSSALKGVFLVKKIEDQMQELTISNEQLAQSYSELKRNQQILIASENMASLGRLSAGIAHEMNTPLAAVMAALQELGFLAEEYKKSINNTGVTAQDHQEIAVEMINNISTAMKAAETSVRFIKGIKSQVNPYSTVADQLFNACDIVDDTLIVMEHLFKINHCTIVNNMEDKVFLFGNPPMFGQIVTNLITNAIDACKPEGGTITISLYENSDNSTVLSIQDTGPGISKENIRKIFEPFFTTKPFGQGTGLGLAIVYDLVNKFGGKVDVESVPGNTLFRITFPSAGEH